jgi:hypothetical protein
MRKADVDTFEKLVGQLESVYDELSILSKKNPNDAVSKFKLAFVNALLDSANTLLGERYRPFKEFSRFDEEKIPQNSDVVFVVSQYLQCFEKLRADNVQLSYGTWYWNLEDVPEGAGPRVETTKPKRLRE